ncbi:hypothetical protein [Maliponia aquimaris]|uniref:Bacterial virulence factor lipase N-terminal domain-containing protein n=1 Tax=Maliponia aquimaris TaxID=1673631 RepID=A0A238KH29_9RHOB|nr:hypothetical protein [Maliponia aquimaris]SMX41894.1 hypothetical protein MAA8898_02481 [Maliponia aquimaris]
MRHVTFPALIGLVLGAAPALAQVPPVCDAALIGLAQARMAAEPQAMAFLRDATPVLDPVPPAGADAYGALFGTAMQGSPDPLDFFTDGAFVHDACIEVTGTLKTTLKKVPIRSNTGLPVPVSIYVFQQGDLAKKTIAGSTSAQTNLRVKTGSFLIDPALRGATPRLTSAEDAFRNFALSAYVSQDQEATLTGSLDRAGDHQWFALDLRQGAGRQLAAVVCDQPCDAYLDELKARLLAGSGPVVARPAPEPPDGPTPPPAAPDFAGDRLSVVVLTHDGAITATEDIDLAGWVAAQGIDDAARRLLQETLTGFLGPSAARDLSALFDLGLLAEDLRPLAIDSTDHAYRIILRQPEPPAPVLLRGVDVVLAQPSGSPVLDHCRIEVEVSHPDHDPLILDTVLDLDNTDRTESGDEKFLRFYTQALPEAPVLAEPVDSLSLRVYPAADFALFEGSQPKPSSCTLTWANRFPKQSFELAEVDVQTALPVLLTRDGKVIFHNVTLRSTARPVFVLLFNATGLTDSNGAPLNPELFPGWNTRRGGRDLQAALGIMARAAHDLFSRRVDDMFIAEAAGGLDKGFLDKVPFERETLARMAASLKPGEVGPFNLENEVRNLANSTAALPRFVILGRSGLPRDTDYCATIPDIPEDALAGSLLIDFLSRDATFDLSPAAQKGLIDPPGPETFATAAARLAARCPDDGSGLVHWVITPDTADALALLDNLETVATYIFGGLE